MGSNILYILIIFFLKEYFSLRRLEKGLFEKCIYLYYTLRFWHENNFCRQTLFHLLMFEVTLRSVNTISKVNKAAKEQLGQMGTTHS